MSGSIQSIAKANNHGAPTESVLPPKAKAEEKSREPINGNMADAARVSFKGASDEGSVPSTGGKMPVEA